MPRVAVVVLGDVGHSPRMKYHCLSLADQGVHVDFVGYGGSTPDKRLLNNNLISIRNLPQSPVEKKSLLALIFKLFWQFFTLLFALIWKLPKMDVILLQNPPGLPALFACWLAAKIRHSAYVVDWHNYTFSIFALRYENRQSKFVRFIELYEFFCGKLADCGICVTEAMRLDLQRRGVGNISTLYDKPGGIFRPFTDEEKREFLIYLPEKYNQEFACLKRLSDSSKRFATIISSTSWTLDEDFSILLSALKSYDKESISTSDLPHLFVIVTGKGPMKDYYVEMANNLNLKNVTLITPWLSAEDYPKILACADIGVSLHSSSSGLDLPMKVVDMQGCRIPVLALKFNCIAELITDGKDGYLFKDEFELFASLKHLLKGFSENSELKRLKRQCLSVTQRSWDENWNETMCPILKPYLIDF